MPTPPLLDIPAFLAPIGGGPPPTGADETAVQAFHEATTTKVFEARDKVEKARKAGNPDDFKDGDPRRDTVKKADWPGVIKIGGDAIKTAGKDLLLASRITEALVRIHGFAGLRDGLSLLRQMLEKCWDTLYPPLEDGDRGVRCAPFEWLDDTVRGSCLPVTLRGLPLVIGESVAYSWHDWKPPAQGEVKVTREDFNKAMREMALEPCVTLAEAIAQSREELEKLNGVLKTRLEKEAPALLNLRQSVEDCQTLIKQILQEKRPATAPASDIPSDQKPGARAAGGPAPPGATREEIYRQLAQAAAKLKELEPHSPIPYLIQRAVKLGALPFPELIKEVVREQKIVDDLAREFGFKEKEAPAAQKK